MAWNGTWTWTGVGAAGRGGSGRGTAARVVRADPSGVLQGPWVSGGSWGGRPAGRTSRWGRTASTPRAASVHRPRTGQRIGWRRLAALAGDVLMVLTWAAMIPGMMWLGVAAGF
ncbi:hypothetical protein [Castellaniella sp.]|uniref:hypothetical protein n=1 Tax=Castellaniella sp. TaxID=1955812 RepID=UPI003C78B285